MTGIEKFGIACLFLLFLMGMFFFISGFFI